MNAELERRASNRDRVAAYFRAHPLVWIPWHEFARIGGGAAWRTRISECRTDLGMTIENRLSSAEFGVQSVYRYVPHVPLGRDAGEPVAQKGLF